MERKGQQRLELPAEGAAEGLLRVFEEGEAVLRLVLGLAAHDDDVPHGALRGLDEVTGAGAGVRRLGRGLGARDLTGGSAWRLCDRQPI